MLTNLPEKQELQEEIVKACQTLLKKKEKRLSFPIKQLSKDDLNSSDKSENLSLHDENDTSLEEGTQSQVYFR